MATMALDIVADRTFSLQSVQRDIIITTNKSDHFLKKSRELTSQGWSLLFKTKEII